MAARRWLVTGNGQTSQGTKVSAALLDHVFNGGLNLIVA